MLLFITSVHGFENMAKSWLPNVHLFTISILKGTATLMIIMYNMDDLNKPCILIPVSSKSVEKHGRCGRLNICNWTVM